MPREFTRSAPKEIRTPVTTVKGKERGPIAGTPSAVPLAKQMRGVELAAEMRAGHVAARTSRRIDPVRSEVERNPVLVMWGSSRHSPPGTRTRRPTLPNSPSVGAPVSMLGQFGLPLTDKPKGHSWKKPTHGVPSSAIVIE